jgi:hypothetical protein
MKKRLNVHAASVEEEKVTFTFDDAFSEQEIEQLKPTGSILVDSDQLSLIYIMETEEDFIYIALSKHHWPALEEAINKDLPVYIQMEADNDNKHLIELENFHNEFSYLKENIADNANYGEEMVNSFTEIFLTR